MKAPHDRRQALRRVTRIVFAQTGVVDHPPRSLDQEPAGARGEVEHAPRLALVALDPKDSVGAEEPGAVEHETDH